MCTIDDGLEREVERIYVTLLSGSANVFCSIQDACNFILSDTQEIGSDKATFQSYEILIKYSKVTGLVTFELNEKPASYVRIEEENLEWHQARPYDAYPAGGKFDTIETEITITDGGDRKTLKAVTKIDDLL